MLHEWEGREMRIVYLVGMPGGPLRRPRHRWVENFKNGSYRNKMEWYWLNRSGSG
jgi:hypothetical protein